MSVESVMTERERALANARTAWGIERLPATYFAWKELALELAAFVIATEEKTGMNEQSNSQATLSSLMILGLECMPLRLANGFLPSSVSVPGGTFKALERRGLATCDGLWWRRTAVGEAALGGRS